MDVDVEPIGVAAEEANPGLVERLQDAAARRLDVWSVPGQVTRGLTRELGALDAFRGPDLGAGGTYLVGRFILAEARLAELRARPILLVSREEAAWKLKQVVAALEGARNFSSTVRNAGDPRYLSGLLAPFRTPWAATWGGVQLSSMEIAPWLDGDGKPNGDRWYQGRRVQRRLGDLEAQVLVNGRSLDPAFDLRNHSPSGFEWGYGGSGPAQLALAITVDALRAARREEAAELAGSVYQRVKMELVARLPRDEAWALDATAVMIVVSRAAAEL